MGRPKDETRTNVTCDICGKVFKCRSALKFHEEIHFGIKEFECEYCHKRFLRKAALDVHLRQHTGEKPYKCSYCPDSFRSKSSLDCHVFRHTRQGTKCPQCPLMFAKPSIVKQHIREVHTTEKPHVCQICGMSYKHRKSLATHLETHDQRICSVCGKVFNTMFALKTHRHIHETNPKCNYCQRSFKSEEELQAHSKLRGRVYQCDMCCYSFNKAEFLNNHNRRDHWEELGLERLPRKIVPRSKKPKPEGPNVRKSKAKHPVQIKVKSVTDSSGPLTWDNPNRSSSECSTLPVPFLPADANQYSISEHTAKPELSATTEKEHIADVLPEIESQLCVEQAAQSNSDQDFSTHLGEKDDYDSDPEEAKTGEQKIVEGLGVTKVEIKVEPEVRGEDTSAAPTLELVDFVKVEITETDKPTEEEGVTVLKVDPVESNLEGLEERKEVLSDSEDDEIPLASLRSMLGHKGKLEKFVSRKDKAKIDHVHQPKPSRDSEVSTDDDGRLYPIGGSSNISRSTTSEDEGDDDDVIKAEKPKLKSKRRRKNPYVDMTCPICGDVLKGRTALKEHKKSAHPDVKANAGPSICELCGKSYTNASSLAAHRGQHKEYQRFKCDECPKAFMFQCFLENHKRVEHRQERVICPVCGKQFKYGPDMKRHSLLHEEEKPFKCEECPATFRHPRSLNRHKTIHKKTVFTCTVCNKVFRYANSLQVHQRLHSGVKRFRCEICDREFHQKATLMKHMAIHSVDRQVKCVVCDKVYYKKVELIIHQAKEHPNHPLIGKTIEVYTCNLCGKEFTQKRHLRIHSDIHENPHPDQKRHPLLQEAKKPIKCEECPATFRQSKSLTKHRANHEKTVLTCSICNKNFRYANSLRVHERFHREVKRFRCDICGREFHQKATLMKHVKIHSVNRQMKCVVCDMVHYKKVELIIHQAKEHPNHPLIGKTIKLYICNVCGKEFTKEGHLKIHSDIHGNEYRFKCDMCEDQKFKQMAGLRYHWKHFHQIEPPKRGLGKKPKGSVTSGAEELNHEFEFMN